MRARPNEQWWANHGQEWLVEIDKRKHWQVYYFLQEAFLSAYFSQIAPAKVLEFGCGFGRHLRYLREIPGLEVYGVDQSSSMLAGMARWADEAWGREHAALIEPGGRLPFPDKSFDVVYTVSVLIHVQPDDVPGVLSELLRVTKGHILHVENAPVPSSILRCTDHDGCWGHPVEKLYRQLGAEAEVLPPIGTQQGVYRAAVGQLPAKPHVDNLAARLRAVNEMVDQMLVKVKQAIDHRDRILAQYGVRP